MSERKPRRWLRVLLGSVVVLLVVVGGAWLHLTAREAVPPHSDYVLDLGELRKLADSLPGSKPEAVATELVAEATLPRAAVFAGESFTPHPMVHQVFQLRWADGSFVLIDTGMPAKVLEKMSGGTFHEAAYAKVLSAMAGAQLILVTHEHADHLSGAAGFQPATGLGARLALTAEQLANTKALDDAGIPETMRKSIKPLVFERVLAVAPGVVVQKAPGHTPGSLLVYVRTAGGREYLFIGDVAWHLDQIRELHYRPRLVTDYFLHEDRKAVMGELRTLHDLLQAQPDVLVVVSHDRDERQQLLANGALHDGFLP
jgi:glyoxylase-like metal-dependent hydrolase (beta-lactamase superfamily II)